MKELKWEQIPCKEIPSTTSVEKLREIVIKDNQSFGEDDWDELKEWDQGELEEWGMEIPELKNFSKKNREIDINKMSDQMTLQLHYTEERYKKVKEQLKKIANTPEQAVWTLLGNK